jgi:GAF domain-containing protein
MITVVTTVMVALITAIIGPIIVNWARLKMEKKSDKTPMREALDASSIIDNQIENILAELECDRVWISQFHNGGHFYPTGKSIQKFSIFYEKSTPNLPPLLHTFQNIPVSLFPRVLSKVYQDQEIAVEDVSTATDTYGLEYMTTQFGTKSMCAVGLYSLDDHLIGVLNISFKEPHRITRDEWILIRQKAGVIGTLLSEYLYATNTKKK